MSSLKKTFSGLIDKMEQYVTDNFYNSNKDEKKGKRVVKKQKKIKLENKDEDSLDDMNKGYNSLLSM